MLHDVKYDLGYQLISDILSQQDILLSVNSGSGSIAEARVEKWLSFRIIDKWATIVMRRLWHIHLNMDEVVEARFVKEPMPSDGRQSYSIRFFDSKEGLSMRANFKVVWWYGNVVKEKVAKFDEMYTKYGSKELLSLRIY
jgi:putative heme iron utilization protein